jgi:hypothetical protein
VQLRAAFSVIVFGAAVCTAQFAFGQATTTSVLEYGAHADGASDCTAAFQRALNACATAGGGTVYAPAGRYFFAGHLNVPAYVCLQGSFAAPPTTTDSSGTVLLATEGRGNSNAEPFIVLNRCSTLRGVEVFYPGQKPKDIQEYPWCVRGHGDNVAIRDVLLVNPYLGVDFGTFPVGRHFISGLYGGPLKLGLFVDKCLDVGRVENVHFWPFWTEEAMEFTRTNGTAFKIAKTDWEYMRDCFCISYAVGYLFTQVKDGPGNAVLTQCGSDVGPLAVKIEAVQSHAGVSFENGQFMAGVQVLDSNSGPVKFTSCGFWGVQDVTDSHVQIAGAGHVSFIACHFTWWDQHHVHAPCVIANSGGLTMNGCEFLDTAPGTRHIELREDVEAAIIQGNRFRAEPRIDNRSEGDVVISGNTTGRKTKLRAAIDSGNASAVAASWRARMNNSPMTSAPESLRLASAMILQTPETAELRSELLRSIVDQRTTPPTTFQKRAARELARDRKQTGDTGPEVPASRAGSPVTSVGLQLPNSAAAQFSFAYDSNALHFSVLADEPKMKNLHAHVTKHDGQLWTDDAFELFLAPRGSTDDYFQLIVNANGAWYDGSGNQRATSAVWNMQPRINVSRSPAGWGVEVALAWSDLGLAAKPGDRWGVDVRRWRFAGGEKEYASWADAPLGGDTHHPEAFGALVFQ